VRFFAAARLMQRQHFCVLLSDEPADWRIGRRIRVNGVLAVAFLPGGKKLAIAGESPLIRFIDLITGKEGGELNGHRSAILSLALSPDGATLASGEWHSTIRLGM
jgi:WD40 repeat protein